MIDQIQLPEPDGYMVDTERGEMFWPAVDLLDARSYCEFGEEPETLHRGSVVRHLIAEAVAAEREACAVEACEFLTKGRNPFGKAVAAAIRARTSAPKTAADSCIQGLRNVIAEDTQP